jgi:hypothetical protein
MWAWGYGFTYGFNLSLTIEDGHGNILVPQVAAQTIKLWPGGAFSMTFLWQKLPVVSLQGLTPVIHAKSTNPNDLEAWAPLRAQDVYIVQ